MHYVANKKMNLAGKLYDKGDPVSDKTFNEMADFRRGAMLRTRLIIEVETLPVRPGDMCPHCDKGPFQRLSQHVSMSHEDLVEASATTPEDSDGDS